MYQQPKCFVCPSGRGGPRVVPQAGPKSPNTGPGASLGGGGGGGQKVPLYNLVDKIKLNVAPERCPLDPKWVHLGPECVKPKTGRISG